MDFAGIYVSRCLVTNKVYVGSALNIRIRIRTHKKELSSNKHGNPHFQYAWNKHGAEAFEWSLLEKCEKEDLLVREQAWIDQLRASTPKFGYNIMHTVRSSCPSPLRSQLSKRMWKDPEFKKRTRAKIKAAWNRPEHIALISSQLKTRWEDPVYQESQSKMMLATWQDPKYRAKIKRKRKAMWRNPEYREKITKSRRLTGNSVSYKAKQSKGSKSRWADPEFKARMKAKAIDAWADPEIRARRLAGQAAGRTRKQKSS